MNLSEDDHVVMEIPIDVTLVYFMARVTVLPQEISYNFRRYNTK